jgi:hypothetical protein
MVTEVRQPRPMHGHVPKTLRRANRRVTIAAGGGRVGALSDRPISRLRLVGKNRLLCNFDQHDARIHGRR